MELSILNNHANSLLNYRITRHLNDFMLVLCPTITNKMGDTFERERGDEETKLGFTVLCSAICGHFMYSLLDFIYPYLHKRLEIGTPYCVETINPYPTIHEFCRLLIHLLVFGIAYTANTMDPDQTSPLGAV